MLRRISEGKNEKATDRSEITEGALQKYEKRRVNYPEDGAKQERNRTSNAKREKNG